MSTEPVPGIDVDVEPLGTGCAECLRDDGPGWWLHLRRCTECGHIGCCDSSPGQHAAEHAEQTKHPFITSFEPDEDWFYNVDTGRFYSGPPLASPTEHPTEQPVPGPEGKVPDDWRQHLH